MFPALEVTVGGLEASSIFSTSLSFRPADKRKYRFHQGSGWKSTGQGREESSMQFFTHPDSPNFGFHWERQPISFKTVKLTNNTNVANTDENTVGNYDNFVYAY